MKSVLAYLLLVSVCLGQTIELPKEVMGTVGSWVEIPAKTDGEIVKWKSLDPRLNLFPSKLLNTTKIAVLTTVHPGRYEVIAVTAKDNIPSDFVSTTVVITGPTPPPPPPPPDDDLAAFAVLLRDSAIKVGAPLEAQRLAGNYATSIARMTAGEYNNLAFPAAKEKIIDDVFLANQVVVKSNPKWQGWFVGLVTTLTLLDLQGQHLTIDAVKVTFTEIKKALEAAAKAPAPAPVPEPDIKPPIPEPGFRVLMFYEKDEPIPGLQLAILAGEEVAAYLDKTCVTEPDGTSGYRVYDQHADLSGELPVWKKAFQRRPESLPWVIISNGVTGYEGPLTVPAPTASNPNATRPMGPSDFIALCRKYEL